MLQLYLLLMIVHTCSNMSSIPSIRQSYFTCFRFSIFCRMTCNLLTDSSVAVCRRKWLQGRKFWNCPVSPGMFQLLLLTVSSLVGFQVKPTGTPTARGRPCEARLFGLLCVRRGASHFASTHVLARPVGPFQSKMPEINNDYILDVTVDELPEDLKDLVQ